MEYWVVLGVVALVLAAAGNELVHCAVSGQDKTSFFDNYYVTWGFDHFSSLNNNTQVQLTMDQRSGTGFESKLHYGSGFFGMRIKITNKKTEGVVTAFYLTSKQGNHDEVDFEFIGGKAPPYVLSTNIFANGIGGREKSFNLWFDPTADFHSYHILWNRYQIVFFVDGMPIRVFKNNVTRNNYPRVTQTMQVIGSIWNAEGWAGKTNWEEAPFTSSFQGFGIGGCKASSGSAQECYTKPNDWWNAKKYQSLSPSQRRQYRHVNAHYISYDYCRDRQRYPQPPPECRIRV